MVLAAFSLGIAPRALAASGGAALDNRGGGLWAEFHVGLRSGDGNLTPEDGEPRALQGLRVGFLSSLGAGDGEGNAHHGGSWQLGLGLQAAWGYAPHEPPRPRDAKPWLPQEAGLCEPPAAPTCQGVRLHPEAWGAWIRKRPLGEATEVELWAGWRPLPGGPVPGFDFELASRRQAPAAAGFGWRVRAGPSVEYERWKARLDGGSPHRYLLGHRLRIDPLPWLSVWVYEVGVVDDSFLWQTPNWIPLWPMYLTQHLILQREKTRHGNTSTNNSANLHIGVAARARPWAGGPELAGELFVDDMQQPFKNTTQPDQIALGLGAVWPPDPWGATFRVRYRRVHRYVYTFQNSSLSYLHGGVALGGPDGPDSDSLLVRWDRPGPGASGLGLEVRRRGPGRLGEIWEQGPGAGERARAEQFMAQPPEITVLAHFTWELDGLALSVALGPVFDVAGEPGRRGGLVEVRAVSRLF